MDPITLLLVSYLECNEIAERGLLSYDDARRCSEVYEQLKIESVGGYGDGKPHSDPNSQYKAFKKWYKTQTDPKNLFANELE